jgi:hypothetical protein
MGTKVNTVGCVDRLFAGELAFAGRLHLYITRELARNAESQFELARVRRMKVALIDHVTALAGSMCRSIPCQRCQRRPSFR